MFKTPPDSNYYPFLNVDYHSDTDCEGRDCGSLNGDYCRCAIVTGISVENSFHNVAAFFHELYDGPDDDVERALAFWLLKRHFGEFDWGFQAHRDYYGERLASVSLDGTGHMWEVLETFKTMTTSEKISYLLGQEYDYVDPRVLQVKKWECVPVLVMSVRNHPNDNYNTKALEQYQDFCRRTLWDDKDKFQWNTRFLAPLCLKNGKYYEVLDGRHRTVALTSEYNLPGGKFNPIYMFVLAPKE